MKEFNSIQVREATEQDIVGIVYVQATSWIKHYQNRLAKISEEDIRSLNFESKISEWRHILKSPNYRIWVAAENENILAFVSVLQDNAQAEIHQQHTLPEYQRRGLGSRLLKEATAWLADTPVSLRIPVYIQSGLDFYRQHGFKVDETGEVDFIRLPSGKQIPTILMRLGHTPQQPPIATSPDIANTAAQVNTNAPQPASDTEIVNPKPQPRLIGRAKLAKISGFRASTIKYYTEIGLLPFVQAEAKLARRYQRPIALARLKEIKKMRKQGMSVSDIKHHFGLTD